MRHLRRKTKKTVAWINNHSKFKCPKCGKMVKFDPADLHRKVKKVEKNLADFTKNLVRTIKIQF